MTLKGGSGLLLAPGATLLTACLELAAGPAALRVPLGIVAVLLAPGYVLTATAFPRRTDLTTTERLVASVALSLPIVAGLALLLDRLPPGLSSKQLVLAVTVWVILGAATALWRRAKTIAVERFALWTPEAWQHAGRSSRQAVAVLAAAAALAGVALTVIVAAPAPPITEFALLGRDGAAEDYPRTLRAGSTATLVTSITNRERAAASYRVVVRDAETEIGQAGPVRVSPGETATLDVQVVPRQPAPNRRLMLTLYRDAGSAAYRELHLWLNVVP